jgi:hypothetical protein
MYSQDFIFFATYEWAQLGCVLHYTRLESLSWDKHSSLFLLYINDTEFFYIEVALGMYSQHFTFFVTYKWAQ